MINERAVAGPARERPAAVSWASSDTLSGPGDCDLRFHIVTLPNYVAGVDPPYDVYYKQLLEQLELAEELGFECSWFTEHHLMPYGGPSPNPAALISAVAARTSTMRLGCSVSVIPLRHPIHIAEDYAVADAISGGRLEFGMGVGNNPREYDVFGVELDDGRAR